MKVGINIDKIVGQHHIKHCTIFVVKIKMRWLTCLRKLTIFFIYDIANYLKIKSSGLGVSKKIKKSIKPKKTGKKIIGKTEPWKKTDQFGFISSKPKNWTKLKPEKLSQTDLNQFLSKKPNRNRSVWTSFGSVLIFLKKIN